MPTIILKNMSAINWKEPQEDLTTKNKPVMNAEFRKWANERLLLRVIKEKLGITDEDLKSLDVVKQKIRDANIEEIINS
jgi:hypothetical protein